MEAKELRMKTPTELDRLIVELRGKLHRMRTQVATAQQTNVRELRAVRKDLARALSVQTSRNT